MIRFELRMGKGGAMGVLQVRVVAAGVNTKATTGIRIPKREWVAEAQALRHPNDQRAVADLMGLSYADLSKRLFDLRRKLDKMAAEGLLSMAAVKQLASGMLTADVERVRTVASGTFATFFEEYVRGMESGDILTKKYHKRYSYSEAQRYRCVLNMMKEYEEVNHCRIGWGGVTKRWFEKVCEFMEKKGLKTNTIANYIYNIKFIIKEAQRQHLVTCDTDMDEWYCKKVVPEAVFLTAERLTELYNVDLLDEKTVADLASNNRGEDREWITKEMKTRSKRFAMQSTADIFLLCCLSGQRFSDWQELRLENIQTLDDGKEYIRVKQKKTGKTVFVPVDPRIKNVMKRRHKTFTSSVMDNRVKRLGRVMGWREKTDIEEEKNGIRYKSNKRFYEFLMTHTGRRTFATLAYQRGVSLAAIMAVTGHSTEEMLRRYLKLNEKERAMMASKELFRITPTIKVAGE